MIFMKNMGLDIFSLTSEDYYTIFENMQEGITVYRIVYDRDGNVVDLIIKYANPASSTSRVFLNKNFSGKSITKLYGSSAVSSLITEVNEIVSTGKIKKYETYSPTIDSFFSFAAFSPAKNLYVTLTTDITEQKKAEQYLRNAHDDLEIKVQERTGELLAALQEKELLLREIHHRVKNNLQIISSLINLQISYIQDEKAIEFFRESQSRIKSISMVHEKLYQSKSLGTIEFGSYISNIVTNLFQTYGVAQNAIEYNLDLDNIKLNIETSIPCGLIITELVTNSIKHAFPTENGETGKIWIKLHPEAEKLTLVVKDNGVGFPEDLHLEDTGSLGLQLVFLLINQIDGSIELNQENGAEFKIKFEELQYRERI